MKSKYLIGSNILLAILLVILFVKGDFHNKILSKIKQYSQIEKVSDEELLAMNNEYSAPFIDINKGNLDNGELRIVIIGNSLTTHAISEKIGWTHESGMAASSLEKDYVHILGDLLTETPNNYNLKLRISNFAPFERNPKLTISSIDSLVSFNPDIVIFQLGENVAETDDLDLFRQKYIELVGKFDSSITICTTPFFPDYQKIIAIESVAINTSSYLVDLSSLVLLDNQNYAKDENNYLGDRTKWKAQGIGIHPGDVGMRNIANRLFITINTILHNQKELEKNNN